MRAPSSTLSTNTRDTKPSFHDRSPVFSSMKLQEDPGCSRTRLSEHVDADRFRWHLWMCARSPNYGPHAQHIATTAELESPGSGAEAVLCTPESDFASWHLRGRRIGRGWSRSPIASDEHPAGFPQPPTLGKPSQAAANLIANAELEGVVVFWRNTRNAPWRAGWASKPKGSMGARRDTKQSPFEFPDGPPSPVGVGAYVVFIETGQQWVPTFDVLVHELAHVLLGHLGRRAAAPVGTLVPSSRRSLPTAPKEVEARSVTTLVAKRLGDRASEQSMSLRGWIKQARTDRNLDAVDLTLVFRVAEILLAWSRTRPDGALVKRDPRHTGPSWSRGRASKTAVHEPEPRIPVLERS